MLLNSACLFRKEWEDSLVKKRLLRTSVLFLFASIDVFGNHGVWDPRWGC